MRTRHKPDRITAALQSGVSIALAIIMIVILVLLWHHGEQRHKSQLQLMRMEAAVNLVNGLEWQAISDQHVSAQELRTLESGLQKIERVYGELDLKLRASPQIRHIHALILTYTAAVAKETLLVERGNFDEARSRRNPC